MSFADFAMKRRHKQAYSIDVTVSEYKLDQIVYKHTKCQDLSSLACRTRSLHMDTIPQGRKECSSCLFHALV